MISQITKLQKGQVKFHGIIETIRDKKSMQFVILKDFSGKIQLFIDKIKFPEVGEVFSKLIPGATVIVVGELIENESETSIFIYGDYKFKIVDAIITNFHLPKSTLIMLISAFGGKEFVFSAYEEAVREKYRFYSFGDSMFIY